MKAGRLDVGVDGYGPAAYSSRNSSFKVEAAEPDEAVTVTLSAPQTGFPIGKDNSGLSTAVNDDIATMSSSGQIVAILEANGLPASAANTGAPRLIE